LKGVRHACFKLNASDRIYKNDGRGETFFFFRQFTKKKLVFDPDKVEPN
jgi:hypothetical protein